MPAPWTTNPSLSRLPNRGQSPRSGSVTSCESAPRFARWDWELTYTADQIANGSRGLLDEVATGKVTGEEEYWSRTDLWDFQANVDGSRVAFDGLRPLLQQKNPALDSQIETQFKQLQLMLDKYRVGDGFQTYDQLSKAEVKELSDAVNALAEPISKLAAAVV